MYKFENLTKFIVTVLAVFNMSAELCYADKLSGRDVMELSVLRIYYPGGDRISGGHITVNEKNGNIRIRDYKMLRLDKKPGGEQSYFVYFTKPNDLDGTTFLVHKKPGFDDDRWLYLPKLDLIRRIAAGDKRTHFVGTDLFYEDISGRHLNDDSHDIEKETEKYWIVSSKPVNLDSVEFKWYKSWVHKENNLVIKREYYNDADKVYRSFNVKKVRNIAGIPTSFKTVITDFDQGSKTTVDCMYINYGNGIPQHLFQEKSMRNPPKDWLEGKPET